MKPLALILAAVVTSLGSALAQEIQYQPLKAEAERLHREGSYARAHELYLKADGLALPAAEARWVDFRIADTLWRSQAATRTADSTRYEKAQSQLQALVRDIQRVGDRDRVWAEVNESLGDFYWTRQDSRNWGGAWPQYQEALDWWAGSRDLDLARERYLKIVWTVASPPWREPYYYYGYYGNTAPLQVLENALRIARSEDERTRARYLIAMTLRHQGGDPWDRQRARDEFEAALKAGKSTDWYDDALYHYAEWLLSRGRLVPLENGQVREEPDFVKALELFGRLIREHEKGETRYRDQAMSHIQNITGQVLGVMVPSLFLADSEIQYHLSWRNLKRVELALYPVDLARDVDLSGEPASSQGWIGTVRLSGREKARSWSRETGDQGDHRPGAESLRLEGKLPPGAYILQASSGALEARDLVLVTDAALVLKTSGKEALLYFASALDGAPIAGARVSLWERIAENGRWSGRQLTGETDRDGLAAFPLRRSSSHVDLFAAAVSRDRQGFSIGQGHYQHLTHDQWRIYAFTDRPAYRPGEEASWKVVARKYDGSTYSTPAGAVLKYQVNDPRGNKAGEGTVTLNEFGSAWGGLALNEAMPLGEYHIHFWEAGTSIGQAVLFRLEEYKLPEFKVSVEVPEEDGRKKTYRLGESIEVVIRAEYYFGGPVPDAAVEALVHQQPFYHYWAHEREFPWYYQDLYAQGWSRHGGGGQVVKRETLRTDSRGKAVLSIDTPRGMGQDLEFRIEARVTDSSRREIVGSESVRVTRQRYHVQAKPEHNLYRPGDEVRIDWKALDANGQPVAAEGAVKVTRDRWVEIWETLEGKEVRGEELEKARAGGGKTPLRPRLRGYEHEDILSRTVKTGANGEAELRFTARKEGYYRVAWRGDEKGGPPVQGEATVWVATGSSRDIGYRHGGVKVIVDRDTFRAGQKASVLLSVPAPGRHVLFTVEGDQLYSRQVVQVSGTVKLIELEVTEKHVPNIYLSALCLSDREVLVDTEQVVVPPVEHFLQVDVKPDREDYLPRDEGSLTVTTRDHRGNPVPAEVALSLTDESVFYIQREYAADPRQFFFGEKRALNVQTHSTLEQKGFPRPQEPQGWSLGRDGRYNEFDDLSVGMEEREGQIRGDRAQTRFRQKLGSARAAGPRAPQAASEARLEGENLSADLDAAGVGGSAPEGQEPAVVVRSDFRSTVFWGPDVRTGDDGRATVKVKFPDSLTRWRATGRVATRGSQFGVASASIRTRLPLIVRLQAPRFFVAGDSVVVSAVINNNTDAPLAVTPSLLVEGLVLRGFLREGKPVEGAHGLLNVPPQADARADWLVEAAAPGAARLKVEARSGKLADAMEKSFPVHEHGVEKLFARAGKMEGAAVTVKLDLPRERKAGSTSLVVQAAPSLAVTMLDALPYLADYPYGCTEQTMSRFLPAAITAHTLRSLGLSPEAVAEKVFGGIEPAHARKTHPGGKKDLRKLDEMAQAGLDRLYAFQHSDGGWGWWKEGGSDHWMTAYVVWGLSLARQADLDVKPDAVERGAAFLEKEIVEAEEAPDLQAWMLHALAVCHAGKRGEKPGKFQLRALENLWKKRDELNAYGRALLALSAHHFGQEEKAQVLARNLENGVKIDSAPDVSVVLEGPRESQQGVLATAHWGEDGIHWRWSEGGVESTSFALRALLAIDPGNKLIPQVANWLQKNRRGAQWSSTRDTAICVLALNEYLKASGELTPEVEYEVRVNGEAVLSRKVTPAEALTAPSRFTIDPARLRETSNEVRIVRKSGKSPLYFAVEARYFSLEEPVAPQGNELFVRRDYRRLVSRPTLLKGDVSDREPLPDQGVAQSGERVEVVLTIEAKNHLEYLVFEDLKPAGFEAVELRSGSPLYARELKAAALERKAARTGGARPDRRVPEPAIEETDYTGRTRWVYQELRDRKVALFLDKLPEGVWEIRYEMRAESPGRFHALPVLAHAMYVPEIRANGAEARITVEDAKPDRARRAVVGGGR